MMVMTVNLSVKSENSVRLNLARAVAFSSESRMVNSTRLPALPDSDGLRQKCY